MSKDDYVHQLPAAPSMSHKVRLNFEKNYNQRLNRYKDVPTKNNEKNMAIKFERLTKEDLVMSNIAPTSTKRQKKSKLQGKYKFQTSKYNKLSEAAIMNNTTNGFDYALSNNPQDKKCEHCKQPQRLNQTQSEYNPGIIRNSNEDLKLDMEEHINTSKKVKKKMRGVPKDRNINSRTSSSKSNYKRSFMKKSVLQKNGSKNKFKKSTSRKRHPIKLPELLPCTMDVNPSKKQKLFITPSKGSRGRRTNKNSPRDSVLSHNGNPAKLSNFKKRLFSCQESPSKVTRLQTTQDKAKREPNQKVLVPLDRIVHERCYNQYLFPNKTLWKYLSSVNYALEKPAEHPGKNVSRKRKKKVNRTRVRNKIANETNTQKTEEGFLNINTELEDIKPQVVIETPQLCISEDSSEPIENML